MFRINALMAVILAVLSPVILHGQNSPPVSIETQAFPQTFVADQNIEIKFLITVRSDVSVDFKRLTDVGDNFTVLKSFFTDPRPLPGSKDYNFVMGSVIIKPAEDLEYGQYKLDGLFVDYSLTSFSFGQNSELRSKKDKKKQNADTIILEKAPVSAYLVTDDGFQDVVNIGEHILLKIKLFKEKDVQILNGLNPDELEKLGIKNPTDLEKPDLDPFDLISSDKTVFNREFYEELEYSYAISLGDISPVKNFIIPSLKFFYRNGEEGDVVEYVTPEIKIRTNSVLNRDSEFRPMKGPIAPDDNKLRVFGVFPLWVAKISAGLAGIVMIFILLSAAIKWLMRIKGVGIRTLTKNTKEKTVELIDGSKLINFIRVKILFKSMRGELSQPNLKKLIIRLRFYSGALLKIKPNESQTLTTEELYSLASKKRFKKNISLCAVQIIEKAEYWLDEEEIPPALLDLEKIIKLNNLELFVRKILKRR